MTSFTFLKNNNSHKLFAGLIALVLVAGMTSPVFAIEETYECTAILEGSQEVPPVNTEGNGSAVLSLDTNTGLLNWEIVFSDLSTVNTASHIHGPAPVGANAGVQIELDTGSPIIGSTNIDADQQSDLLAGLWYINIHTENFQSGEIRGQITCEDNRLIGGTVGSMSTTTLLVAGAQSNMGMWGLALVGIVGAAAAITYKVKSKSEQ
jgi:phosphotransferase system  glucose/maltose/N-acetylglucosamine-specific IIC component